MVIRRLAPATTRPTTTPRSGGATFAPLTSSKRSNRPKFDPAKALAAVGVQGPQEEKPRSLFNQFTDIATGIPAGVRGLLGAGIATGTAPIRMAVDVATGREGNILDTFDDGFQFSDIGDLHEEYSPLTSMMHTSLANTGERVIHPTQYWRAMKSGNLLDVALEDIGNAALVAGPIGKALGSTATAMTVPTRVASMLEATGEAAAGVGEARSLSSAAKPATAFSGRSIRQAMKAAGREAGPAPRVMNELGELVPETVDIMRRGRGLAGAAERAGDVGLAEGLSAANRGVQKVVKLGEVVDKAQFAWPAQAVTKPLGYAAKRLGVADAASGAVTQMARGSGVMAGLARSFTEEGRQIRGAGSKIAAEDSARARQVTATLAAAKHLDLDEPMQRLTLLNLDQRFYNIVDQYAKNESTWNEPSADPRFATKFDEYLDTTWEDMPDSIRPTLEDIQNQALYNADKLDPDVRAKVDQVMEVQRGVTGWRTAQELQAGVLNPEQLESFIRESVVKELQDKYQGEANRAQKKWTTAANRSSKATRMLGAVEMVNRAIPEVPDAKAAANAGFQAGRAVQALDGLTAEYRGQQTALQKAIEKYNKIADQGEDTPAVRAAAREVDRLAFQIDALHAELERQVKKVETLKSPVDQVPGERPKPRPTEGAEHRVDQPAAKAAVKEAQQELLTEVTNQREAMGGHGDIQGPTLMTDERRGSTPSANVPDHWIYESEATLKKTEGGRALLRKKRLYEMRGYFHRESPRGGGAGYKRHFLTLDEWASTVKANPLYADMTNEAILDEWLRLADQENALRSAGNRDVMEAAAARLDMEPHLLEAALYGDEGQVGQRGADAFRERLVQDMDEALDELHEGYQALEGDVRDSLELVLDAIRAEPDEYTSMEVFQAVADAIPGAADRMGIFERLDNGGISTQDALDFMRTGETTETFYTAVQRPPTQAERYRRHNVMGQATGTRRRIADAYRSVGGATRTLDAAERVVDNQTARAARDTQSAWATMSQTGAKIDEATGKAKSLSDAKAGHVTPSVHIRRKGRNKAGEVTNPLSQADRQRMHEGVMRSRAGAAAVMSRRAGRVFSKWQNKVGNVRSELELRWQDRMYDEVNVPAMKGYESTVRRAGEKLGGYIAPVMNEMTGEVITPGRVDGLMGQIAKRAGFMDALVDEFARIEKLGDTVAYSRMQAFHNVVAEVGAEYPDHFTQLLEDSWKTEDLLEQFREIRKQEVANGNRLNSPNRVYDLLQQQEWMPDELKTKLKEQEAAHQRRKANYINRIADDTARAAPARHRAVMLNARRDIGTFLDMAESYNKRVAGSGDVFMQMAEDSAANLAELVERGIDPTHLIGGKAIERPPLATGSGRKLSKRKQMAQHLLTEGYRPMDLGAYSRSEVKVASDLLHEHVVDFMAEKYTVTAESVIGDQMAEWQERTGRPMPEHEMTTAIRDAGFEPFGDKVMQAGAPVLSRAVKHELTKYAPQQHGSVYQALQKGNRAFKTAVLPFSTKWHVGNVIGNAMMAVAYGGVGPVELARTMQQVANSQGGWRQAFKDGGLPAWAPDELANHGLSYGEHQMIWQGLDAVTAETKMQSIIATSFKVNEFWDNMFRSSVYLSQVKKGAGDLALRNSLNAMGNYTKMTSFERRVVREVFPFYAWVRHQTAAAIRLPLESPTRAAWLYSMAQIYGDPEMSDEANRMLGGLIPIGGGSSYLNVGTVNPFPNLTSLPLDPTSPDFGRNITPAIALPLKLGFGFDVDKMRAINRPADTANKGVYGEALTTPSLSRLKSDPGAALAEMAYQTVGDLPFGRSIRDAVLGGQRYDTGQLRPVQRDGQGQSLLQRALSGAFLPTVQNMDDEIARVDEANKNPVYRPRPLLRTGG